MPYGTDSRLNVFQAINCLATIIQSLRDRVRQVPDGTTNRPRAHIRESYVTLAFLEDEDDDEDERGVVNGGKLDSLPWAGVVFFRKFPLALY